MYCEHINFTGKLVNDADKQETIVDTDSYMHARVYRIVGKSKAIIII